MDLEKMKNDFQLCEKSKCAFENKISTLERELALSKNVKVDLEDRLNKLEKFF